MEWKTIFIFIFIFAQDYVNFPVLCHNIVWRDLDSMDWNITLIHYISDIVLVGQDGCFARTRVHQKVGD